MKLKVVRKQPNSKMCIVCGLKNDAGLHTRFYELENGELYSIFRTQERHQSYPGRLHGGVASTLLDEAIGRAVMIGQEESVIWGVTLSLTTRFKKPLPLDTELYSRGRIDSETKRGFEGSGEIYTPDGEIAVSAQGKFLKLPLEDIADFDPEHQEWGIEVSSDDPVIVEL